MGKKPTFPSTLSFSDPPQLAHIQGWAPNVRHAHTNDLQRRSVTLDLGRFDQQKPTVQR